MKICDADEYLNGSAETAFLYVGFLKLHGSWIPLCALSDPQSSRALDMIYVSRSYDQMSTVTSAYAQKISGVEETFVQCLMPGEIRNLAERYGLKFVAELEEEQSGCGCGCGCSG